MILSIHVSSYTSILVPSYVEQGDELCATRERLKERESELEVCQQGCAEKEEVLKKRNGRIEHLSSEISRMNRLDNNEM